MASPVHSKDRSTQQTSRMQSRRRIRSLSLMVPLLIAVALLSPCCARLFALADPSPSIPELGASVISVSEGSDCTISVTTSDGSTLSMICANRGICRTQPGRPSVCQCYAGYSGSRCEVFAECTKDADCFHGACDGSTGRCHCESGWLGLHCMMRGTETAGLSALSAPPVAFNAFNPLQFVPIPPTPADPFAPAPPQVRRRLQMLYTGDMLAGLEDGALITQISLRYSRLPLPSVVQSDDPSTLALTKFQLSFSLINSSLSPLPASGAVFTSASSFLNVDWTAAIARRSFTSISAQPRVSQSLFNDPAIRSAFGNPVAGTDSTASATALPPASSGGGATVDASLAFVQLQPDLASSLGVSPSSSGTSGWMHVHLPTSAHFRWSRDFHFVIDLQCDGLMPFTAQASGLVSAASEHDAGGNVPAVGAMDVGGNTEQGGAFEVASSLSEGGTAGLGCMLARVWAGDDTTTAGAFSNTTAFNLLVPLRLGSAHWAEAPYISSIVPSSGNARGGTVITVSGSNFPVFPTRSSAASEGDLWNVVLLNEHACTSPRVVDNSSFTCVTPLRLQHDNAFPSQVPYTLKFQALSSGLVVSNAAASATFTYNSPPIVYDVTPRFGGPGTRVQLIGAYFGLNSKDVASVRMGNITCGSVEFASSNLITCTLSIPQERNTVVERAAHNAGEPKAPRVAAVGSDGLPRNDTDSPPAPEPEPEEDPALEIDIGGLKETLGGEENLPIVVTTLSGGSSLQNDETKSAAEPRTTKSFTFQIPPVLRVSAKYGNDSLCSQPALGVRCASLGQALRLYSRAGATFLLERGVYRESLHGPLAINHPQISIQSLGLNPSKVKMLCAAAGCFAYGADDHELQDAGFTAATIEGPASSTSGAAQMRYFFPRVIAGITFEPDWALQEQLQVEADARAAAEAAVAAAAAAEAGVQTPPPPPPAPTAPSFNNQSLLTSSVVSLDDSLLVPGPPASSFFSTAGGATAAYGRGVLFHLALANRLVDSTSSAAGSTCGLADQAATNNNAAAAAAVSRMVQQNTAAIRGVADVPLPVAPTNVNDTSAPGPVLPPSTLTSSSASAPMLFKYCVFSRVLSGSGPAVLVLGSNVVFSKCRFESNLNVAAVPSLAGSGGALLVAGASNLMVSDSSFESNAAHYGGAIVVLDSSLASITSTSFLNNTAWQSGGALFFQSGAVANITATTFVANRALSAGGATFVEKATLFLRSVQFQRNFLGLDARLASARAQQMKGSTVPGAAASAAAAAEATLAASAFSNSNNGLGGGALRSVVASLHLDRVDFDSNHAGWPALGEGGAIHATYSTLGVNSCQFTGNMASRGGALSLDTLSALFAINSTFASNIAGYGMTQYNAATKLLSIRVNSSINLGTLLAPVPHKWGQGGALFLTGCVDSSLERVRFTNNLANDGGALYLDRSSNSGDAGGKVGGQAARASSGNAVASILNATFTGNVANGRILTAMADAMAKQAAIEAAIAAEIAAAEAAKQGRTRKPGKLTTAAVPGPRSTTTTVTISSDPAANPAASTQKTNSSASNSAAAAASLQVAARAVNGGGAIVSVTAPFACTLCSFASNSAPMGGGGAILWQDDYALNQQNWLLLDVAKGEHPELTSYFPRSVISVPNALTTFDRNSALYGPDFATVPSWIRAGVREDRAPWRIFPLGSTVASELVAAAPTIKEQSSGLPLKPSFCVELLDAYGQLVPTEDSSLLRVRVVTTTVSTDRELVMPSTGLQSARTLTNQLEQTGQSYRNFIAGRANFTDLGLVAQPGSNVTLTFEAVLASGSTISTAGRSFGPRWAPSANRSSASVDGGSSSLVLRMRSCDPGEFLDPEANRCVKCAPGTSSFDRNAFECLVQEEEISEAQLFGLLIIFVLFLALEIAALVGVIYYRHHRVIFSASPLFCCVILIGGIVTLVAACIMVLTPLVSSVQLCSSSVWLLNLGFMLSFGSMVAKTFRLYRIFDNALFAPVAITNRQLLSMLAALIIVDSALIALWQGMAPERLRVDRYRVCVSELSWIFAPLLIALKACLVCYGAWLTYQVRSIPSSYNESKFLGLAIFSVGFVAFVVLGLEWGLGSDIAPPTLNLIQSVGVALGSFLAMLFIFAPHAHNIWRAQKERRENEAIRAMKNQIKGATAASSTSKSGSSSSDSKRGSKGSVSKGGAYAMASGSPIASGGADSRHSSVSSADEFDFHPAGPPLDVADFTLSALPIPAVVRHLIKLFSGKTVRHPLEQQFVMISTELSTATRAEAIALKRLAEARRDVMANLHALSQVHFEIEFQKENSHGVLDPARCKVWPEANNAKKATGSGASSARNSTGASSKPVTQPNSRRTSKVGLGATTAAGAHAIPASVTASNSSSTQSTPRASVVQRGSFDGAVHAGSGELELTRLGAGAMVLPPSGASSLASSVAATPDRSAQVSRRPSQVDVLSTIRDLDTEAENALLSPIMSQGAAEQHTPLPGETPNTALTANSEEAEWGASPSPSHSPNPTPSPGPAATSPWSPGEEGASASPAGSPNEPAPTVHERRRSSFGQAVLGVFDSHHLYPPARRYSAVRDRDASPVLASPTAPQPQFSDVENPSPLTPSASPPAPHYGGSSMVSPQLESRHLLPQNMGVPAVGAFRRGAHKEKPPLPKKMRSGSARGSPDAVSPAGGNTPTALLSPSFGPIVPSNPTVAAAAASKLQSLSASPSPSPSPLSPPPRWNAASGMAGFSLHPQPQPQTHQPHLSASPSPSPSPNPPLLAGGARRLVSDFSHATPPLDRSAAHTAAAASGQKIIAPNLRIHPRPNRSPIASPGGSAAGSAVHSAAPSAAASPIVSANPSPTASPKTLQHRLPHAISIGGMSEEERARMRAHVFPPSSSEPTAAASGNGRHSRTGSLAQAQAAPRDEAAGGQP